MSESFDPYLKWLGIKPKDQPPDHYRLLGVDRFESDAEIIENAADQRMNHVRTFQSGRYSADSQSLLNEITAAKVCLLDEAKKAEYDARLRAEEGAGPSAVPVSPMPVVPAPAVQAPPELNSRQVEILPHMATSQKPKNRRPQPWLVLIALAGASAALLIVAALLLSRYMSPEGPAAKSSSRVEIAKSTTSKTPTSETTSSKATTSKATTSKSTSPNGATEEQPQAASQTTIPAQATEANEKTTGEAPSDLGDAEATTTNEAAGSDVSSSSPFARIAAADCLVAYTFNEERLLRSGRAMRVQDLGPLKLNGIIHGASALGDGRAGGGLHFDGRRSYILVNGLRHAMIQDCRSMSLCVWIRPDWPSSPNKIGIVFDVGFAATRGVSMALHGQPTVYAFTLPMGHGGVRVESPAHLDGQWHHLVGVWDGPVVRLYVDGELKAEKPLEKKLALSANTLTNIPARIGTLAKEDTRRKGRFYPGAMDELLILRRALTADEVRELYHAGLEGKSLDQRIAHDK